MKKERNTGLKIISLVLAFIAWIIIFNLSDSVITETKSIKIETINKDVLADKNLAYQLEGLDTVNITYKVRAVNSHIISDKDINAFIDLSEYSVTGALPVYVEILNEKGRYISDIEVKPSIVKISTERIQSKTFEIESLLDGDVKTDYSVNNVALNNPEVIVTGPMSQVGRIAKAVINVDINKLDRDTSGNKEIVYLDSNNNKIDLSSDMKANIKEVGYNIKLDKSVELDLKTTISGKSEAGTIYTSYNIYPSKIRVKGNIDLIDSLSSIELGVISIDGKLESFIENISLQDRLPDGVVLDDRVEIASINVNIAKIEREETEESTEGTSESLGDTSESAGDTGTIESKPEETEGTSESEGDASKKEEYGPGMTSTPSSSKVISESSVGEILEGNDE